MFKYLVIVICLILLFPLVVQAQASVDVPLGDWSYDAIEKLAIIGLADILEIGFRPVSRIRMAYIIKTAIEKANGYELDFDWREQEYLENILYDLIDEFREELVTIGVEVVSISDKEPERFSFGYPELDLENFYARLDTDTQLFENNDGWKLKDGFNLRVRLNAWAKIDKFFAISIMPGVRYSAEDIDLDLETALIRFSHPNYNMELSIGRSSMWWGPGFHGSLLLSNNAFPLDIVRWNNIYPFRLPGILKKIGRFDAQFFISRLEKDRVIPNPFVTGWRVDYAPCNFLKLGFAHILMYGGKGVKNIGFSNFWSSTSLVFSAAGGENETEDHIISGDLQLFIRRIDRFLPIATGAKLYTEWGGEDEINNIPVDLAHITGAYFTDVFKVPGFDAKIEFARLHRVWYTHFRYASGYTHRGNIIGHFLGGDAKELAVTSIFNLPGEYKMSATFSHQQRGISKPNTETIDELQILFSVKDGLKVYNIENTDIDIFYEFQDINNIENTTNTARNHIIGVKINRMF